MANIYTSMSFHKVTLQNMVIMLNEMTLQNAAKNYLYLYNFVFHKFGFESS